MKKTFSTEDIVEAAFQVVRKQGRKKLSARTIAKELNASTMPIYSTINSMKDLEAKIGQKFTELLLEYCLTPWTGNLLVDMSFGYVRFAKDEKELFRLMFLADEPSEFVGYKRATPTVFQILTSPRIWKSLFMGWRVSSTMAACLMIAMSMFNNTWKSLALF